MDRQGKSTDPAKPNATPLFQYFRVVAWGLSQHAEYVTAGRLLINFLQRQDHVIVHQVPKKCRIAILTLTSTHDKLKCRIPPEAGHPARRASSPANKVRPSPAVVSVNASSLTISQPWLTAYEQAGLKSGIFQSPISEVSARSSRVSEVIDGNLRIDFRDGAVHLVAGEMFVVPKGVEHKPYAENEVRLLLIEPRGVPNTGDRGGERTAPNDLWI
jgi:hypothetical protein